MKTLAEMNDGLSDSKHKHKQHLTGLLFWQQGFTRHLEKTNGLVPFQIRKIVKKSWTGCFQIGGSSVAITVVAI